MRWRQVARLEFFARIGMGVMLLASTVVGVRLLLLARRTRKLPEFVMGVASLGIGIGSALVVLGSARIEAHEPYALAAIFTGLTGTSLGASFLCIALWRIFRPDRIWAPWLAAAAGVLLFASLAVLMTADHASRTPAAHPAYFVGFSIRIASYAWLAAESIAYASSLLRRARLGLADPMMGHRFLCWGISASAALGGYLVYFACALRGIAPPAPVALLLGFVGLVSAGGMWLAFFPPVFYRRWATAAARPQPS